MDPTLTRADRLVGQTLGQVGSLSSSSDVNVNDVFVKLELLGVRTKVTDRQGKVAKLQKEEMLLLNIGSMFVGAEVIAVRNDLAKLCLKSPVCTSKGEKVALSWRVDKHWRLIGWG